MHTQKRARPASLIRQLRAEITTRDAFLAQVSRRLDRLVSALPSAHVASPALRGFAREFALVAQQVPPEPHPESFDVGAQLEALMQRWWPRWEARLGPRPSPVIVAPAGLHARVDPEHFETLIAELVSNAYKYGGAAPLELRVAHGDRFVRIRILDAGRAVPAGVRRSLGRRFVRSTAQGVGFGIGLWLAQRLARANAGRVSLRARPGGGTEARLELPVDFPPGAPGRVVLARPRRRAGARSCR